MASTFSSMASSKFTMFGCNSNTTTTKIPKTHLKRTLSFKISAQEQQQQQQQGIGFRENSTLEGEKETQKEETKPKLPTPPRPIEKQLNTQNKNMNRDQGGEWLSCTTRHVRLFAAYIDMETFAMDQTQTDKLTLLLDPTEEFLWTTRTENMVYSYFQELVDHYEGAPLTEYTLRLIGSDIEHYIRKLLYDGEIQYNMEARVLNFSMGKPRIGFSYNEPQLQDVNDNNE